MKNFFNNLIKQQGTSSAIPTSIRNITGILVKYSPTASILMDPGEASFAQMTLFFGSDEKLDRELLNIHTIYISHNHLDHYSGLIGLIKARVKAASKYNRPLNKINLIIPRNLNQFIDNFNRLFENFIHENCILMLNENLLIKLNFPEFKLQTCFVKHTNKSTAISIEFNNVNRNGQDDTGGSTFKLVYSGDCRPSEQLIKLGYDCDLLIHEATYDDSLRKEAILNKHSLISEGFKKEYKYLQLKIIYS